MRGQPLRGTRAEAHLSIVGMLVAVVTGWSQGGFPRAQRDYSLERPAEGEACRLSPYIISKS
jgi:hypothetical protein